MAGPYKQRDLTELKTSEKRRLAHFKNTPKYDWNQATLKSQTKKLKNIPVLLLLKWMLKWRYLFCCAYNHWNDSYVSC